MDWNAGRLVSRGPRTWLVRVYLGREPETGTLRYHNKTIRVSFREAQTYLNTKLQERGIGRLPRAAAISLNQYLDQWLTKAAKPRLPITHVVAQGVRCNAQKAVEERP